MRTFDSYRSASITLVAGFLTISHSFPLKRDAGEQNELLKASTGQGEMQMESSSIYSAYENLWVFQLYEMVVGYLIGALVLLFSVFLILATEAFAVHRYNIIGVARRICVPDISSNPVNSKLDGRVVHITGEMKVSDVGDEDESGDDEDSDFELFPKQESSSDDDFELFSNDPLPASHSKNMENVAESAQEEIKLLKGGNGAKDSDLNFSPCEKAVVLRRIVEMLQWKENSEIFPSKSPSLRLEWSEVVLNSKDGRFQNPKFPDGVGSKSFYASTKLGAYRLSSEELDNLKEWKYCSFDGFEIKNAEIFANENEGLRFVGMKNCLVVAGSSDENDRSFLYFERTNVLQSKAPVQLYGTADFEGSAGDLRISFKQITEGPLSVVGVLKGKTIQSFQGFDSHDVRISSDEDGQRETGTENCIDAFSEFLFDAKIVRKALLIAQRKETMEDMFEKESKHFNNWLSVLRLASLCFVFISAFIILYPTAHFFPYFAVRLDRFLDLYVFVTALLLGLSVWMIAVGSVWFQIRPWILTVALGSLAVLMLLCGGILDGVWWDPIVPLHLSWTVCGEMLLVLTIVPACFVVNGIHHELQAARSIQLLNMEADVDSTKEL